MARKMLLVPPEFMNNHLMYPKETRLNQLDSEIKQQIKAAPTPTAESSSASSRDVTQDVLRSVPMASKKRAEQLMNKLRESPSVNWDDATGEMEDQLTSIYYDTSNPASFGGIDKLLFELRSKGVNATRKAVKSWLEAQNSYTLHRPRRKRFKRNRIIVSVINELWECDIMDCSNVTKYNKEFKYLLVVIDALSKYGYARKLKSKNAVEVCKAFTSILKEGHTPINLRTDRGSEFINKCFKEVTDRYSINHYFTYNETKAAIIERWIRTLRMKMARYFTANNTRRYVDVLDSMIDSYNNSVHSSIGMKPSKVTPHNQKKARAKLYKNMKEPSKIFKYKVGQNVRISKLKKAFDKDYEKKWTDEIFIIRQLVSREIPVYKINDLQGERIEGTFYDFELNPVKPPTYYKLDRILKERGNKYYVKFRHYDKSFNQWVNKSDVVSI
ncbi:putative uncharacterized transposon-derived protein F54H12.3 [Nymphon striatum]|nr:putative uncharacterized transposon-derived protein F54H12.3 [Nymphon striatum]